MLQLVRIRAARMIDSVFIFCLLCIDFLPALCYNRRGRAAAGCSALSPIGLLRYLFRVSAVGFSFINSFRAFSMCFKASSFVAESWMIDSIKLYTDSSCLFVISFLPLTLSTCPFCLICTPLEYGFIIAYLHKYVKGFLKITLILYTCTSIDTKICAIFILA